MTSKEELLKRFKEERIAREKARIQMLHDMNRKKYSKHDENAWKHSKSNSSLNVSDDISPAKNAMYKKKGPIFVRHVNSQVKNGRVKKYFSLHSFCEESLNVSAPIYSNASLPKNLAPKRRSMHNPEPNASNDYSSPSSTTDSNK